jgi:hypothetical protein
MSFFRHEEIYRPMDSKNVPGRSWHDRPRPHRYDEFPAGYSSAGCAPAEPASASPAEAHLAGIGSGSTIELQRAVNRLLTPCLTQGDNPNNILRHKSDSLISVGNVGLEFQKAKCLAAEGFADNYILMTNYGLSGASEEKLRKLFLTIPGIKNFVAFGKTWIDHKIRESARLRMLVPQV